MADMAKQVEPVVHRMLPGSHERGGGAECRCGAQWDRFNDECFKVAEDMEEFRSLNFAVTFGSNDNYFAVENNFSNAEFSFAQHQEVKNTVTMSIEDLQNLIPVLQLMVDTSAKFGKK